MFWHKGKHKLDENDAAMQYRTLRNFTTALVINLLYRLTLLHQWLRENFFHSNFLVTVLKRSFSRQETLYESLSHGVLNNVCWVCHGLSSSLSFTLAYTITKQPDLLCSWKVIEGSKVPEDTQCSVFFWLSNYRVLHRVLIDRIQFRLLEWHFHSSGLKSLHPPWKSTKIHLLKVWKILVSVERTLRMHQKQYK